MGGKSPILEQTQSQADAIEESLKEENDEYKCFIVMRCWNPRATETIKKLKNLILVKLFYFLFIRSFLMQHRGLPSMNG